MTSSPDDPVTCRILKIRGQRVILDTDLARLYGVTTSAFNQTIKRNARRFPGDFAFRLTLKEFAELRAQYAAGEDDNDNSSQFVMSSGRRHRAAIYRPWVFTEHGAVMAANVLRSAKAIQMSIYVVRAFLKQREELAANLTILKRLAEIDKTLLQHDAALRALWKNLQPLLQPLSEAPAKEMGFHTGLKKRETP